MNTLKIHVFDDRIMNDPMSSYDRRIYKKLSSAKGIHVVNADDGSYLICFSGIAATEIIPSSLLDSIQQIFSNRGGVVIKEVYYHTNSRLGEDFVNNRWFEVLLADLNRRQSYLGSNIRLTVIDDAPKTGNIMDFSRATPIQRERPQVNFGNSMSQLEADIKGYSNFQRGSDRRVENDSPFDDIDWNGEHVGRDDTDDSSDSSDDEGYFGELDCVKHRKAEKRWRKSKILTADEDTIKHDAEIIRAVLKEIAPGDEPWLVIWRAKMEERIMRCMVITKDELEDLERNGNIGKFFETTKSTLAFAGSALGLVGGAATLIGRSKM